jgi:hypothetical protein
LARDGRDVADADVAQLPDELGRVVAHTVADRRNAGQSVVDGDQHLRVAAVDAGREVRLDPLAAQPARAADEDAVAVDRAAHAVAEALLDALGNRQRQVALLRARDEGLRQRVRGHLVDRRRQPQGVVGGEAVRPDDSAQLRMAERDGAGLVEQDRARLAELLDRSRGLGDDARTSGTRHADMNAIGAARISGQGVATTNTASALTGSPDTAQAAAATAAVNGNSTTA